MALQLATSFLGLALLFAAPSEIRVECRMTRAAPGLAGVTEASGVAVSRKTPGILWTHGDSHVGEPHLFAFDAQGTPQGKVRLEGIRVSDWEDIEVAPCGPLNCLYVADIGDNRATRKSVTIFRFLEPRPTEISVRVIEAFHAAYPDGAHDAESFFVAANGRMFIVTKGETGPVAVYGFVPGARPGSTTMLQKIAVLQTRAVPRTQWVTGATASPDGRYVAMRTHRTVFFYDAPRLMRGDVASPLTFDATSLREPQGEGIAMGSGGSLFLAGEGGRKGAPGTLSSGVCRLPSARP